MDLLRQLSGQAVHELDESDLSPLQKGSEKSNVNDDSLRAERAERQVLLQLQVELAEAKALVESFILRHDHPASVQVDQSGSFLGVFAECFAARGIPVHVTHAHTMRRRTAKASAPTGPSRTRSEPCAWAPTRDAGTRRFRLLCTRSVSESIATWAWARTR